MKALPKFKPGARWTDLSARELQNLSAEVDRVRNLTGGRGLNVSNGPGGLDIRLSNGVGERRLTDREPVVVVGFAEAGPDQTTIHATIQEGDSLLVVRRADYKELPPTPDSLGVFGETFRAYPAIGVSLAAFADSVTTGTPTIDSAFFTARRRSTIWFVDGPGGSGGGTTIAQYKFVRFLGTGGVGFTLINGVKHFHDAIVCHKYEADGVGIVTDNAGVSAEFTVMLPYLLRGGPFDSQGLGSPRNGITYTRVSAQNRDAENAAGDKEQQVIVPSYASGDRIFSAPAPALHPLSTETAVLLDLNVDGRAWARVVPQ